MYGFILLHLKTAVHRDYGDDGWNKVRLHCGFPDENFTSVRRYPDQYITLIAKAASEVLRIGADEFFETAGTSFIRFLRESGYNTVVSVLGRSFRDFVKDDRQFQHIFYGQSSTSPLNEYELCTVTYGQKPSDILAQRGLLQLIEDEGMDYSLASAALTTQCYMDGVNNLHHYMSVQFPSMEAPTFTVERENKKGLVLHYRSKRNSLVYYLIGILKGAAAHLYDKDLEVELSKKDVSEDGLHAVLRLNFINDELKSPSWGPCQERHHLPISLSNLLHIFPFAIILNKDMRIEYIGSSLSQLVPHMPMTKFSDIIKMDKSSISYNEVLERSNIVYNLSVSDIRRNMECRLHLKGQMIHLKAWDMIIFLGTPLIPTLAFVMDIGLFLNDLPMHDFSRDNVLTGTQESSELRLSLETEQDKTAKVREAMRRLDEEVERTNRLLYQMIPQHVTEQLKTGKSPVTTCETFKSASILLSDVVRFTEMCIHLRPMEVVTLLNRMYSIFDRLTEKHRVCKIETIGDAYMVVAGLQHETDHAARICDMALEIAQTVIMLKDPNTGEHLRVRVGVSTGAIVAGVVGQKMPRYCLFGKTSLLAAVMEQSSEPMKIHLSQRTADHLSSSYILSFRGIVNHPEFMGIRTYWLEGKHGQNVSRIDGDDCFGGVSGQADTGTIFPWCIPTSCLNSNNSCFLS